MPNDTAPARHRNPAPPRPSKEAPKEPSTLAEHEEAVRSRLIAHGQHGALDAFSRYVAAVAEKLDAKGDLQVLKETRAAKPVAAPVEKPKKAAKKK